MYTLLKYVDFSHYCIYYFKGLRPWAGSAGRSAGRADPSQGWGFSKRWRLLNSLEASILSMLRPLNSLKISKRLRLLNSLNVSKHFQAPKLPSNL